MFSLSEKSKTNVEKVTGLKFEDLVQLSVQEEISYIEQKLQSPLTFSKKRNYLVVGRGNPLLSRKRIKTLQDVNRKSKDLFGV